MTVELQTHATEDSSYVVTVNFEDEDGDPVTPDSIDWTLRDDDTGSVVNSREDVAVAVPASTIYIVLYGDDLEPLTLDSKKLLLTVSAVYDSALQNDLPLVAECYIWVDALEV